MVNGFVWLGMMVVQENGQYFFWWYVVVFVNYLVYCVVVIGVVKEYMVQYFYCGYIVVVVVDKFEGDMFVEIGGGYGVDVLNVFVCIGGYGCFQFINGWCFRGIQCGVVVWFVVQVCLENYINDMDMVYQFDGQVMFFVMFCFVNCVDCL